MKIRNILMLSIVLATLTISCENDVNLAEETVQNKTEPSFVAGELLIKFKDYNITSGKSSSKSKSNVLSLINGTVVETINTNAMKSTNTNKGISEGELVLVSSKLGTMEAIAALKNSPEVEYAEPNWIYQHFATSNDTYLQTVPFGACMEMVQVLLIHLAVKLEKHGLQEILDPTQYILA